MRFAVLAALLAPALVVTACSSPAATHRAQPNAADDDGFEDADPITGRLPPAPKPDYVNEDAGVFGPGDRAADAAPPAPDASPDAAANAPLCAGPIAVGDLVVVELMVQTAAGAGDHGEWVEVKSTRDCALALRGVRVWSPRGDAGADAVEITTDAVLPPRGTFVVASDAARFAGSTVAAPLVFAFAGAPTDVLKNDGDTVTLAVGDVVIDTLTYPRFTGFQVGRSMSFPADCAPADRASFARWSYSFAPYGAATPAATALKGTPNQDNTDVACY